MATRVMRMLTPFRLCIIALWLPVIANPRSAHAQNPAPSQPQASPSWVKDWAFPIAALGGSIWIVEGLNADDCNWCDRDENGEDTLNGFDHWMRDRFLWGENHRDTSAYISDGLAATTTVVPYLLAWPKGHHAAAIQAMAWTFAVDGVATGIPKYFLARERPHAHFDDAFAIASSHPNASFPSNHTSRSFASVFAAVRICQMIECDHEERIWLVGLPLATATGLLRIGGDKHYGTDVLAGAAIGAVVGWYSPLLSRSLRTSRSSQLSIQPSFGRQTGVIIAWAWQ